MPEGVLASVCVYVGECVFMCGTREVDKTVGLCMPACLAAPASSLPIKSRFCPFLGRHSETVIVI